MKKTIPSVNYHLTKNCNMKCKFCYATFQDITEVKIDHQKSKAIIQALANHGFEKITFAGGEPTLVKGLDELLKFAQDQGLITCLVTNGSRLLDASVREKLFPYVDWLTLSIDSVNDETNIKSGRSMKGRGPLSEDDYLFILQEAKKYSMRVKINTVVSQWNKKEDLSSFIMKSQPERWKILQAMSVKGQNSEHFGEFEITTNDFQDFISRHYLLSKFIDLIPEEEELIRGSYVMIGPDGRFFDSTGGFHQYSQPILEVGIEKALKQVFIDSEKFLKRGGLYDFGGTKKIAKRITLSGGVASGKTTIGKLLAKVLGYKFVSIGEETRKIAQSQGMDILALQNRRAENKNIDIEIDQLFSEACNAETEIVIDYRMGFKFIKNSFNILLLISEDEATKRLESAHRPNESVKTVRERNNQMVSHFQNLYGLNFLSPDNYDLTINVEEFSSAEEIVSYILSKITTTNKNH